ncbi:non-specific lipid transfer protein GPI-anchored 19-like [Dioscorea cayenensis subsp. rotundata]|uniref:Non-specific lipid transfer protein GPI-anchored 19-like n=1 Tax=Dioscorea cayennensis subsp. rotundata TaxID=55577 RepID=A0AB40CPE9_DIOCR|nr:non-specific lipid transfer protein GPI-anchored 19-like [Dioscorea cayenensis subsp. rotundata]
MEIIRNCFSSFRVSFLMIILLITSSPASSQISTPCTNTLLSSFTPCLNYLTGSTNGGGSPTSDCCDSLGSLISSSAECACMIITGNVPIPINRALAISLPKICNSKSVPLQCKTSSTPLPAPGPVAFAPSLPPLSPTTSNVPGSDSSSQALPPFPTQSPPALTPPAIVQTPTTNSGQPTLVIPSSAFKLSGITSAALLLIFGTLILN